ncbi:MAG: GtrA family protein [Actinomycetota bacterium]
MTSTLSSRAFLADHGAKLLRYCGVSVINVIVGQAILAFCLAVVGLGGVPSQVIAAMLSAIPAYILSKRWVWKQTGQDSFRNEVLPFWIIALVGLIFAVSSIAVVEQFTDNTPVIMLTSLGAYGVVWVAKYLILDRLMWASSDEPAVDSAR